MKDHTDYEFDFALSFVGEDREFAAFLANDLTPEFRVFYDEFQAADLWGADLSEELPLKYQAARYAVILFSDEYLQKMWTVLERQAIVEEFLRRRGRDYVLVVRVRGCKLNLPGVSGLTGYMTAVDPTHWNKIRNVLREKLLASRTRLSS